MNAFAYESIVVSSTPIGFTEGTFAASGASPARAAFITVEDASCRYRIDGTDPTSSEGHLLSSGDDKTIEGLENLYNFRAIREAPVDATLRVTYLL